MFDGSFLQNPCVRDLAWVIANPPLIQGMQEHQYWTTLSDWSHAHENFHQQLQALDENPSELVTLLNKQRDHRLGHRFETLLTYWLKHNGRHKILAKNLQIQNDNRTIGEFDLIVEDTLNNTVQHWEVACKFYLGVKNTNLTEHWVRPMLKDRLDIKHNAMQTRQSKLSKHPAAQQKLKQLNIHIDEHICLMKGRLFHQKWPPKLGQHDKCIFC